MVAHPAFLFEFLRIPVRDLVRRIAGDYGEVLKRRGGFNRPVSGDAVLGRQRLPNEPSENLRGGHVHAGAVYGDGQDVRGKGRGDGPADVIEHNCHSRESRLDVPYR